MSATRSVENLWLSFKYERLSDFCLQCGHLGHEKNSCRCSPSICVGGPNYDHELKTTSIRDLRPISSTHLGDDLQESSDERITCHFAEDPESRKIFTVARDNIIQKPQERVGLVSKISNLVISDVVELHLIKPQQPSQASSPSYYVEEPPDSLRGELITSKPTPDSVSPAITSDNLSPQNSPRSIKQNTLVDIILAHVFDDLTLKRKVPNDFILKEDKRSKLQKALRQQIWSPVGGECGERTLISTLDNNGIVVEAAPKRAGRIRHFQSRSQAKSRNPSGNSVRGDEKGLGESSDMFSLTLRNDPIESSWSQLSQVQSTFFADVSLSPANGCGGCLLGGLALWWTSEVALFVLSNSKNVIDATISTSTSWQLTCVYADPVFSKRIHIWKELQNLGSNFGGPWLCIGDFIEVGSIWEKQGGHAINSSRVERFNNFVSDSGLTNLEFKGIHYTWSNKREGDDNVRERIDKALANTDWRLKFLYAQKALTTWSKEEFGNNKKRLAQLKNQLYDQQLARPLSENMGAQRQVIKEMEKRRQRNQILRLKGEDGVWCSSEEEINGCIAQYFSNLFQDQGEREVEPALNAIS
ncbi:hypothetical protein Vadar_027524 [Vaccinium darrowii]|uniref:Uncharacterized protein n=1 Tax=Vaccinium darrowii TaxID=229202 RepID=A0ACB7Z0K0_9ERIC|nr:hypothetical protein Vadar_027524 [Vaccinium darrowii]